MSEIVTLAFALHLCLVAEVPVDHGVLIHLAAEEWGVDEYDLAAAIVSENSWRYADMSLAASLERERGEIDYEEDALGKAGEMGIAQVAPYWASKSRKACEERSGSLCEALQEDALFDPRVNARVAAYVVLAAHESHSEHAISHTDVRKCKRQWRLYERGELSHVPACQLHDHGWGAHYKLGPGDRDIMCGQPGYQKRKIKRVRESLTSIVRPAEVWEEGKEEWAHYCGGQS